MSEQISALIDDELSIDDAVRMVNSMQSNKQATEVWSQYHLIGDAMRGSTMLSADFKHNLMQKLELEPTVLAPNAGQSMPVKIGLVGNKVPAKWSIAASVAAVMMVGWVALHEQMQSGNSPTPISLAKLESAPVSSVDQLSLVNESIPAEYLIAHQASAPSAISYYIQSVNYSE
jgi:sigma-E factor negative regulatory protein RseA